MGHTIDEWRSKVSRLVRDHAGRDILLDEVDDIGIAPALSRYSEDRPRRAVEEVAGSGSAFLDLPEGWVADVSRIEDVEYPAQQNPRTLLDRSLWSIVESDADVLVDQILLPSAPSASEWVRLIYLTTWPMPDDDEDTDLVGAAAYEAVTKLAAALCLDMLAAEASRNLHGSFPNDLVDGTDRALRMQQAADRYRADYERFVGRFGVGSTTHRVGSIPLARIV